MVDDQVLREGFTRTGYASVDSLATESEHERERSVGWLCYPSSEDSVCGITRVSRPLAAHSGLDERIKD